MPDLTLLLFVGFALVFGASPIALGLWKLRPVVTVLRSDPMPVVEAANERGPVEIEGTAEVATETVTAPFTGTECLAYECELERRKSTGNSSSWSTTYETGDAVPFLVDDGDESLLVDPDGADFHLGADEQVRTDADEQPPEPIADHLQDNDVSPTSNRRRQYTERRLEADGPAHVYGTARHDTELDARGASFQTVVGDGDGAPFLIADADERGALFRMAILPAALLFIGLTGLVGLGWILLPAVL